MLRWEGNVKKGHMKIFALLTLLMATSLSASETAFDVFTNYSPSVVLIQTKNNGSGSGFFVTPSLILTNRHVVRSFSKKKRTWDYPTVIVLKDGKQITKFNSILCSQRVDVCAISVDPEASIKKFSKLTTTPAKVGQDIFVVGHPQGVLNPVISSGIVSSEPLMIPGFDHLGKNVTFKGFTTTAAISRGSSGSPVLSKSGEILGIAVSIIPEAQNLNLIIGSEELSTFAKQITKRDGNAIFTVEPEKKSTSIFNLISLQ